MSKPRIRFFSVLTLACCCLLSAFGASRLEFPRLALESGQIMGVAVVNPNRETAELMLTAYGADGAVLSNQVLNVPAESQLSVVASEIFSGLDPSRVGWFRAESMSNDLTGFFLFLSLDGSSLDGADLPVRARNLVFAQVEGTNQVATEINLVNPGIAEAHVTARLRTGTQTRVRVTTLPARGTLQFDPREYFSQANISPAGELEISSDEDLIGFQLVRYPRGDSIALNARSRQRLNRLYFPQIVLGGGFTNSIALKNSAQSEVSVLVTAYNAEGQRMDLSMNPRTLQIPAGQVYRATLATLLGFDGGPVLTGWLEVRASKESISGEVLYRVAGSGAAAAVPALESGSRRILFSHLATTEGFFTGVALLNPGRFPAALRGTAVSRTGRQLGRFDLVLGPGERISRLITELIPESTGQNGGYVWMEADSPVFATSLFGSGVKLLANVPPQPSPPQFRADSDFPARPELLPSQAAATMGETVQFFGDSDLEWRVNGITGGAGGSGLIDQSGLFTAPGQIESTPAAISAANDDGAAAAAIDLLTLDKMVAVESPVSGITSLPVTGRVYYAAEPAEAIPAGDDNGHRLYEVVEGIPRARARLGFIPRSVSSFVDNQVEKVLLVARDGSGVYLYDPRDDSVTHPVETDVSAAVFDPISRSILVVESGILRGITNSSPEVAGAPEESDSGAAFSLGEVTDPVNSLGVDYCTGNIFMTTESGLLRRLERATASLETLQEGLLLGSSSLLIHYRQGVSCPDSSEILLLSEDQLALFNPTSQTRVKPWSPLQGVRSFTLAGDGRILTVHQDESLPPNIVVPVSNFTAVDNGGIYSRAPSNPPQVELLPVRSRPPGLDLEVISVTAGSGQSVSFNLFLRPGERQPKALVFSFDLNQQALIFDNLDSNSDGIPDAVLSLLPAGYSLFVNFDPDDENGELDFVIADLDLTGGNLETGNLLSISFQIARGFEGSSDVRFSRRTIPSAADESAFPLMFGETLAGTVTVGRTR